MNKAIDKHRDNLSAHAPKIGQSSMPVDMIGAFIGPGGKNIKSLAEKYEVEINVEEDGSCTVLGLDQNGINSVVAPLGTALTEEQLYLAWKYSNKPTIMFDGDNSGVRASYKAAIMALSLVSPNKFLQFISTFW